MQSHAALNGVSLVRGVSPKEPLGRVQRIGDDAWLVLTATLGVALLFHIGAAVRAWVIPVELIAWDHRVASEIDARLTETIDIEQEKVKPPEPPPPLPDPEPVKPTIPVALRDEPPPPPVAAEAAKILAANDDPNEPVDLTDSFVTGNGETYAGGVTQAQGTSKTAVTSRNASAQGQPGGTGTNAASQQVATVDKSRPLTLAGSSDWTCPFPAESDQDQIDDAFVTVSVTVDASGRATSANVLQDPGHGFGREARACAMRQSYAAALDRDGTPVGATKSFRIHFER